MSTVCPGQSKTLAYSIAGVEREVGLSKDVLRVWERRYGFPVPSRDAQGDRVYSADQVHRLRVIRRLMDKGHRPGRLMKLQDSELSALMDDPSITTSVDQAGVESHLNPFMELLLEHQADRLTEALQQRLAREGLRAFVLDTIAPLTVLVGHGWAQGTLQIFEEHLFTELSGRVLRQAVAAVPGGRSPRVLLTTLPQEQHGMGLLMLEALLALEGAHCVSLGTQTPVADIVQAVAAHQVDVVALSFSAAFPLRQISAPLQQLRSALSGSVLVFAGGAGVRRLKPPVGVQLIDSLQDAALAIISSAEMAGAADRR